MDINKLQKSLIKLLLNFLEENEIDLNEVIR